MSKEIIQIPHEESATYKVGDKVWHCWGNHLILCTVRHVDMTYRDKSPDGVIFYDLDEPIGHSQTCDELIPTLEEAFECLRNDISEDLEDWKEYMGYDDNLNVSLLEKRESSLKWLHQNNEGIVPERMAAYPNKEHGKEWFRIADLAKEWGLIK